MLRIRLGTYVAVARKMGVRVELIEKAARSNSAFTAGLALEVARIAGVPFDDVISGRFPAAGSCPMCGQALQAAPHADG